MYSDLQTVFRFLHVFTGRIQSVNGLGLFQYRLDLDDEQAMKRSNNSSTASSRFPGRGAENSAGLRIAGWPEPSGVLIRVTAYARLCLSPTTRDSTDCSTPTPSP